MSTYNHIFGINFEVVSQEADGSDVTGLMLIDALLLKVSTIATEEQMEDMATVPHTTSKVTIQ
jgi:hypothetical protein